MRRTLLAVIVAGSLAAALPATAQNPPAATVRVVGTVAGFDGNRLTVNAKDGQSLTVVLGDNAAIYGVEKRTVADIKPGDFLASGGVKGTDGKIHAVEVRIFPEPLRGIGEGQKPWGAKPEGVMTNATVSGSVTQSPDGGIIHVKYKDGESDFVVGPDVQVLAYVPAGRELLKPGAAVATVAQKQPDGTLTTSRLTAEKDGVKPPN